MMDGKTNRTNIFGNCGDYAQEDNAAPHYSRLCSVGALEVENHPSIHRLVKSFIKEKQQKSCRLCGCEGFLAFQITEASQT